MSSSETPQTLLRVEALLERILAGVTPAALDDVTDVILEGYGNGPDQAMIDFGCWLELAGGTLVIDGAAVKGAADSDDPFKKALLEQVKLRLQALEQNLPARIQTICDMIDAL